MMRAKAIVLALAALAALCAEASAYEPEIPNALQLNAPVESRPAVQRARDVRSDTLWIFDADFEDLLGDNAGWVSEDRSGTLSVPNHWHKDTIRINGFEHLGDSTWWCGTYNPCWRQPRGYGNNWNDILVREFPEVAAHTDPGGTLILEYDQRYAMEKDYDYGYTEVSADEGVTWTTVVVVDNPGFAGTPGMSQDWDSITPYGPAHVSLDLSDYAGQEISIRFRFESDAVYSSQDQYNNPPMNSCLDGAWQLDNFALYDSDPLFNDPFWVDDCESPGSNGWMHDDIPAAGQAGVTWWRGLYGTDLWTNRPYQCDEQQGWMYAAVDPLTCRMVDEENAWLISPPIDVAGVSKLVGQWDMWFDMPRESEDIFTLWLASGDDLECVSTPDGWVDEFIGGWYGGPAWYRLSDDWDAFAGNNWLAMLWQVTNTDPPWPGYEHWGGLFLNRVRVGEPVGPYPTVWDYGTWDRFHDTFDLAYALTQEAEIDIRDDDDIVSASLIVSNDGGQTWGSYSMIDHGFTWEVPNPSAHIAESTEILYYFEATDALGDVSLHPDGAPEEHYEFSVLPIVGSVSEPAILLVDKHGRRVPDESGTYRCTSEDYYREAMDVLGFEYDVFTAAVPSGVIQGSGPDTAGMKYYDTQLWFSGKHEMSTVTLEDVQSLSTWLGQASGGAERNLLITGNNVGLELDSGGSDTLSLFYRDWLASEWLQELSLVSYDPDSIPLLRDASGGFDFLTFDDGTCGLWDGCPMLTGYDVVQPTSVEGAELVAEYVDPDLVTWPAGVAYTHATTGYQTVNLGFGMEFMMDSGAVLPGGGHGNGINDRVDLMANVMEYFGKTPTATPTGVDECEGFANLLYNVWPNPFNATTLIEFALARESRVAIGVYDVAGRVVRTLVDEVREVGPHTLTWDGTTDSGLTAASGVYFVRMEVPGESTASRKLVLLR